MSHSVQKRASLDEHSQATRADGIGQNHSSTSSSTLAPTAPLHVPTQPKMVPPLTVVATSDRRSAINERCPILKRVMPDQSANVDESSDSLQQFLSESHPTPWDALSDSMQFGARERQVALRLMGTCGEAAIATELGLAEHYVHNIVGRVYAKLEVKSRAELQVQIVHRLLALGRSTAARGAPACCCLWRCPVLQDSLNRAK